LGVFFFDVQKAAQTKASLPHHCEKLA
jgi:hypothetical protein